MVQVMTAYPELGTRAVNIIVFQEGGLMGRVSVSRAANDAMNGTSNGVTSSSSNLTEYGCPLNIFSLQFPQDTTDT